MGLNQELPIPGVRILCRNAEWLVIRVEPFSSADHFVVDCVGIDDLVRRYKRIFLTLLDPVEPSSSILAH